MILTNGRILRRAELVSEPTAVRPVAPGTAVSHGGLACGRLVKRAEQRAQERAREIIAEAKAQSAEASTAAARVLAERQFMAGTEARASALAELAARATRLARHEAASDERQLDRIVSIARLLAERLIGAELSLDEDRVIGLAREVLLEVRGARQVILEAHPEDARVLRRHLSSEFSDESCDVVSDESLGRGHLRLRTEVGVVDTRLDGRLELLAEKLMEGLRS